MSNGIYILLNTCRLDFTPTEEELSEVEKLFEVEGFGKRLIIPENFTTTIPAFVEGSKTDYEAGRTIEGFFFL